MFLMADASSSRAEARSALRPNSTDAFPLPAFDTDEVPTFPLRRPRRPSIFDVTSASTTSAEAPGYENETVIVLVEEEGLYWTFSFGSMAMPITDKTAMTNNTENDDIFLPPATILRSFYKWNNIAPAIRIDSQGCPPSFRQLLPATSDTEGRRPYFPCSGKDSQQGLS